MSFVAPAIWPAEPVILKLPSPRLDYRYTQRLDVVTPLAVALIDLACDSFELYNTIGILLATPSVNVTLVPVPKFVALTVG